MATAAGAWDRLRDQLQSLERALAAASAPGACPAPAAGPSSSSSSSSRVGGAPSAALSSAAAAAAAHAVATAFPTSSSTGVRRRAPAPDGGAPAMPCGSLTVLTRGGGALELAVPDPDAAALALQAPTAPRLAAPGRVQVCTGRKCCAQGARSTLAAAQRAAAGSGVEVTASKCMGKCGRGPCVRMRVEGVEGVALTKGVDAEAAPHLLRQQFGVAC
jgi:(2Fe-2S) ferredoxin